MANYPQELAQDAVCQSHTGHMTVFWFLPARPLKLNTNEWSVHMRSLGASSPLCYYKQLRWVLGASKHNFLVSYLLCWRRRVSATVDHLPVAKMYIEENYTDYDHSIGAYFKLSTRKTKNEISLKVYNMHLYYVHTLYSFPLYTFLWPEDGAQWPKHVVVSLIK